MTHTAFNCDCTEGKILEVTIRKDAAQTYQGLCIHTYGSPVDQGYLMKLRALEGKTVGVSHVFRGPTGLPTGYSAGNLHLTPLLVVDHEPAVVA